jgi:hypothetical protein
MFNDPSCAWSLAVIAFQMHLICRKGANQTGRLNGNNEGNSPVSRSVILICALCGNVDLSSFVLPCGIRDAPAQDLCYLYERLNGCITGADPVAPGELMDSTFDL